jgi:hypothetical protein
LPQFLGTLPRALSPLGALPYLGLALCWSRTHLRTGAAWGPRPSGSGGRRSFCVRLARWPPATFFEGPTQGTHRSAHRRDRHPHPRRVLPKLAMALQGSVGVLLELLPQGGALLLCGEDDRGASRRRPRRYVFALAAALEPALEGGKGDPEGAGCLLPWHPTVEGAERLDPQVFGVSVHARSFARGAVDLQVALGTTKLTSTRTRRTRQHGGRSFTTLRGS